MLTNQLTNACRHPMRPSALVLALLLGACSWVGSDDDAPVLAAAPVADSASLAALDSTAGAVDPVIAAGEPELTEADTALVPDAPPVEAVQAASMADTSATPVALSESSLIEVRYSAERGPERMRMIAPDGTVLEPVEIEQVTTEPSENDGWPNIQAGLAGGSSSGTQAGINIGFPIFGDEDPLRKPLIRTRAVFQLPDVADYQRNWMQYRIVMDFAPGSGEDERLEMLPPHPDALM